MRPACTIGLAAALASSVLLAACADRQAPAAPAPDPTAEVALATFEAVVDPAAGTMTIRASRAAAGGDVQPALQPIRVVQDGVPGAGPPDSVELVTTRIGPVVPDGCGPGVDSFEADVTVRSFFAAAWLVDVHVELTTISLTAHEACNAAAPVPGLSNALGLFHYGTLGAGSPQGAAASRTWRLRLPSQDPFTFTGRVMATVTAPGPLPCAHGTWLGGGPLVGSGQLPGTSVNLSSYKVAAGHLFGPTPFAGLDVVQLEGEAATLGVSTWFPAGPAPVGTYPLNGLMAAYPAPLAVGDVDGDGFDDVVVGTGDGPAFMVLRSDGVSAFLPPAGFSGPIGAGYIAPGQLVLADLDGDADLDVMAVTPLRLHFFENDGLGGFTFLPAWGYSSDMLLASCAVLDFDLNALPDVACAANRGGIELISVADIVAQNLNQVVVPTRASLQALAVGDVNGDGFPDLVAGGAFGLDVAVNQAGALPAAALTVSGGAALFGLALGDADGDGLLDAVGAGQENFRFQSAVFYYPNFGGALQQDQLLLLGPDRANQVVAAELLPGSPAEFLVSSAQGVVPIVLGAGGGLVQPPFGGGIGAERGAKYPVVGDIDGDGLADLLFGSGGDYTGVALGRDGGFTFRTPTPFARSTALIDLDRNGRHDFVWEDIFGLLNREYGQADGTFLPGTGLQLDPYLPTTAALRTLDLNGDGWPDLVSHSTPFDLGTGSPTVTALLSTGGGGLSIVGRLTFDGSILATGDLSHDGFDDVVLLSAGGGLEIARGGPGGLSWAAGLLPPGAHLATAVAAAVGDLDGDGWNDIALVTTETLPVPVPRRLHLLRNQRDGTFGATELAVLSPTASGVHLADLDANGTLDVVVTSMEHVALHAGDGAGGLGPPRLFLVPFASPWGGVVADLTGDGRPDVTVLTLDDVFEGFATYPAACAP